MKKLLVVATATALCAAALASSAGAEKPTKGPFEGVQASFPAGTVCPFAVTLADVESRKFQIVYGSGLIRVLGHRVLSVTNDDTGETRLFALDAMFTITLDGPLLTGLGSGSSMWFFFPGDRGAGQPGALLYIRGRAIEVDNIETATTLSFEQLAGTSENLCETMA